MTIQFLGMAGLNDGTETTPPSGPAFDPDYTLRLAKAHEDNGWDKVLFAYSSATPDPAQVAAFVAARTERLGFVVAHRPNVSYPTFAATTYATLDQASKGRVSVHFITGGTDADQAAEGDHLPKDDRYARTREYLQIVKQAWTSREAFSFAGTHYQFEDFAAEIFPAQSPRPPISFGGSSAAAYRVGAAEADVYALWGEPLEDTAEQITAVQEAARAAGRADAPQIQVAFRPILARTDDLAWERAHRIEAVLQERLRAGAAVARHRRSLTQPENAGSQRLLRIAGEGSRHGAIWTRTAGLTGGGGNSTALVGSPETVARALVEHIELGVDIISARGYDTLPDAVDFGRHVIPLVRQELAHRHHTASVATAGAAGAGAVGAQGSVPGQPAA
jgi:alkanesulfonate monooxygenase